VEKLNRAHALAPEPSGGVAAPGALWAGAETKSEDGRQEIVGLASTAVNCRVWQRLDLRLRYSENFHDPYSLAHMIGPVGDEPLLTQNHVHMPTGWSIAAAEALESAQA
jgi:hypothetical protein